VIGYSEGTEVKCEVQVISGSLEECVKSAWITIRGSYTRTE